MFLCTLNIGLMKSGRAACQKEEDKRKYSVLFWFFTRNSVPPSSSRSFRTQSYWSFITGQCINSEQFLRVHLSHRVCNQFTFHRQFRIETGRSEFEQQTDSVLSACGFHGQKPSGSWDSWPGSTASCMVPSEKAEDTSKYGVLGRHKNLLNRKGLSSIKHDRMQSSFTTHSQLIVSRGPSWWELEKSHTGKYMCHLDLLQRFLLKTSG